MVKILYFLGTEYLSSCDSNLKHMSSLLLYKNFSLKKDTREQSFQLSTKKFKQWFLKARVF